MVENAQAATPHPLTVGLKAIELACSVNGAGMETRRQFEAAYCAEVSRLVGRRLGVPVERVRDAGPADGQSLPRVGIVWIRSIVELGDELAIARSDWGSHMPERGVPRSEEASPVTLPRSDSDIEASAVALADAAVRQMPFVPGR